MANVQEMKAWLLDRYAASAFNKCPHQPLPQMDGPPVEIHLVEDAVPRKVVTPAMIPLHWQEQAIQEVPQPQGQVRVDRIFGGRLQRGEERDHQSN